MLKNFNIHHTGLLLGPLLFFIVLLIPSPGGMEPTAWRTTAVTLLIATWWITEAIPIPATSLLPIVLFPVLGISSIEKTCAPYANPLVMLFLGGFIIATAMQTWNLHKRIALRIILFVGTKSSSIIIGFIIASAFISMWVSNTATALMMLPIALSILHLTDEKVEKSKSLRNFEIVLVLSIAYACSIGGIATLIGTPPNALFAAFISENYGIEISFVKWMAIGVPLIIILLPLMYFTLTHFVFPLRFKQLLGGRAIIEEKMKEIGKITKPELRVAIVFGITACLWIFRPLLSDILFGLSDAGIAITAGVLLFILPSGIQPKQKLLNWSNLKSLPWGILILFGGGLSLAMAINTSGLALYIGEAIKSLNSIHIILLILLVVLVMIFLTEITSNTAVTATFLPILASMAISMGQNPMLFTLPATVAASCAFMMPVATPPNAVIYGSGKVSIPQMAKAGLWLNLIISPILTFAHYFLFTRIFGIEIDLILH